MGSRGYAEKVGRQFGELLGLVPQSFMHHFRKCPGLRREKHEGVFVYFADEPKIYKMQRRQKQKTVYRSAIAAISESEAVFCITELCKMKEMLAEQTIKNPHMVRISQSSLLRAILD